MHVVAEVEREEYKSGKKPTRFIFVDFLRGLTVLFVVLFHLMWNMDYFELVDFKPEESILICGVELATLKFLSYSLVMYALLHYIALRTPATAQALSVPVILMCIYSWKNAAQHYGVAMIMFILGMSLALRQSSRGPDYEKFVILFCIACGLTILTSLVVPRQFIYFGAIHCLALNSLLGSFIVPVSRYCGWIGFLILLYTPVLGKFPLEVPVYPSLDLMPWFNNLGFVAFGIYAHHLGMHALQSEVFEKTIFPTLGHHSLKIYLTHQLILFPLVFGVKRII